MYPKENDIACAYAFGDIPAWLRMVLLALIVFTILSLGGCGSAAPVENVQRNPPAADMARLDPLPH